MDIKTPEIKIKTPIREVEIDNIKIGNDKSIPFMRENGNKSKPFLALEISFFEEKNYPQALKNSWGESLNNFKKLLCKAEETDCDILCIHFNIEEENIEKDLENSINELLSAIDGIKKPLIIKGTNNKNIDKIVLPKLAKAIKKESIIAFAEESTYEQIIPEIIKNNHIVVLRSPIDINLAKELNILSMDLGLTPNKILIDTDMGALGYGLDYGYSMIEKVKQAAFDGDEMLNMPIITFVGEETFKIKETKTNNYDKNWGDYNQRAVMWEIASASAIISTGANIVVVQHPQTIKTLKELLWN